MKRRPAPIRGRAGVGAAPVMALRYPGIARPVVIAAAEPVMSGLAKVLRGWSPDIALARPADLDEALCGVAGQGGTYGLRSVYLDEPMTDLPAASAVCGVIADLSQGYVDERAGSLALHCGAVRIGGQLVALTGPRRAGKSTLIARLTAETDMHVFCDDVLPVENGAGVGLGVAPRLRLPLPADTTAAFRAHVDTTQAISDDRYAYLAAPNLATHGTSAPLKALVVLDRQDDGPARLHHLPQSEAVQHLMARNMAEAHSLPGHLEALTQLARGLTCLRLVYSGLEDAVSLLRACFGGVLGVDAIGTALPAMEPDRVQPGSGSIDTTVAAAVDPEQVWQRVRGIGLRHVGEDLYLWNPSEWGFVLLNRMGAAVWAMLEEPGSARDLAEALAEVLRDTPRAQIEGDIAALLGGLAAEGMVLPQ